MKVREDAGTDGSNSHFGLQYQNWALPKPARGKPRDPIFQEITEPDAICWTSDHSGNIVTLDCEAGQ